MCARVGVLSFDVEAVEKEDEKEILARRAVKKRGWDPPRPAPPKAGARHVEGHASDSGWPALASGA